LSALSIMHVESWLFGIYLPVDHSDQSHSLKHHKRSRIRWGPQTPVLWRMSYVNYVLKNWKKYWGSAILNARDIIYLLLKGSSDHGLIIAEG